MTSINLYRGFEGSPTVPKNLVAQFPYVIVLMTKWLSFNCRVCLTWCSLDPNSPNTVLSGDSVRLSQDDANRFNVNPGRQTSLYATLSNSRQTSLELLRGQMFRIGRCCNDKPDRNPFRTLKESLIIAQQDPVLRDRQLALWKYLLRSLISYHCHRSPLSAQLPHFHPHPLM